MPRKESIPSFSISMVKLTAWLAWLRVFRKSAAVGISGITVRVSSTYRVIMRQFAFISSFSSNDDINTLDSKGPRGDPIATPSVFVIQSTINWNN